MQNNKCFKGVILEKIIEIILITAIMLIFIFTCITKIYNVSYFYKAIELIIKVVFYFILLYIGVYDVFNRKIKNKMIGILFFLGIEDLFLKMLSGYDINLLNIFIQMIIMLIFLYTIYILSKKAIGGGDIKLLVTMLLFINLYQCLLVLLISSLLASIYGIIKIVYSKVKKRNINNTMAFGIFILIAVLIIRL